MTVCMYYTEACPEDVESCNLLDHFLRLAGCPQADPLRSHPSSQKRTKDGLFLAKAAGRQAGLLADSRKRSAAFCASSTAFVHVERHVITS
jgi:hypothetical protein